MPIDIVRLSYLPSINRFMDTNSGCIVHTLYPYFENWQLDQWKRKGQHGQLVDRYGNVWGIEYLNEDEEMDAFDFIGFQESFGLQVVRDYY